MKKKIIITGMSCSHCVMHVTNALSDLDDVIVLNVSLEQGSALIESVSIDDEALIVAIEDYGFTVSGIETE